MVVLSKAYRIPLVLALLCFVAAAALALEWYYVNKHEQLLREQLKRPIDSKIVLAETPEDNLLLEDESKFEEMMTRPLFIQSRRPLPEKQATTSVEDPTPVRPLSELAVKFTGFIHVPSGKVALVQDIKTRKYHRLHKGEQLNDWILTELYPDKAVFKQNGAVEEILLRPPKPLNQRSARRTGQSQSAMRRGTTPVRNRAKSTPKKRGNR